MLDFFKQNTLPPKHGWCKGDYIGKCNNCSQEFIGAKGAYHCADCAYNFDEQLQYEKLWREIGWSYTAEYITKKLFRSDNEKFHK